MSIFNQDIEQAARTEIIRPGTRFWNEWLGDVVGPSRLSHGIDVAIRDNILCLSKNGINMILTGGVNLDQYLCDIQGIDCEGFIKITGQNGVFEMPSDHFLFKAVSTIAVRDIDVFRGAILDSHFLNIFRVNKISDSDLSEVQIIHCDDLLDRFENCKFGNQTKIYYTCEYEQMDRYFRICPEACIFVQDVLNTMKNFNAWNQDCDETTIERETFWAYPFKWAFTHNISNMFGVTNDVDKVIILVKQCDEILVKIICDSYFNTRTTDSSAITRDNFKVLWTTR